MGFPIKAKEPEDLPSDSLFERKTGLEPAALSLGS